MSLVFVYGTLKRGGSNHGHLVGQSYLGDAHTAPGLCLYGLGGYPGMVEEAGAEGVRGEVWSVDAGCLVELDRLEGTSEGLYRRGPVELMPPFAGSSVEAYYYLRSVEGCPRLGRSWAI